MELLNFSDFCFNTVNQLSEKELVTLWNDYCISNGTPEETISQTHGIYFKGDGFDAMLRHYLDTATIFILSQYCKHNLKYFERDYKEYIRFNLDPLKGISLFDAVLAYSKIKEPIAKEYIEKHIEDYCALSTTNTIQSARNLNKKKRLYLAI